MVSHAYDGMVLMGGSAPAVADSAAPATVRRQREPAIDVERLVSALANDLDLLIDLRKKVSSSCRESMASLRRAVDHDDADGVGRECHRLRGTLGMFHATRATQCAERLERIGLDGDLAGAPEVLAELAREIAIFLAQFRELVDDLTGATPKTEDTGGAAPPPDGAAVKSRERRSRPGTKSSK